MVIKAKKKRISRKSIIFIKNTSHTSFANLMKL